MSRETERRMREARALDKAERDAEKAERDAEKADRRRERDIARANDEIREAERLVRIRSREYKPSNDNLSPQTVERGRATHAARLREAEEELAAAQQRRRDIGKQRETSADRRGPAPGGWLYEAIADARPTAPTPYRFGPPADGSATGQGRVGTQALPMPNGASLPASFDPVTGAIVEGVSSGVGLAGGTDIYEVLFGIDPGAKVFVAAGDGRRWADRIRDFAPENVDQTRTVGQLMRDFYTFDEEKVRDLQYKLYIGGFFGNADPTDIAWGVAGDDNTGQAWQLAVVRASRFYAANKELSVDDVIALAGKEAGEGNVLGSGSGGGGPTLIQLTDPAALGDEIDEAAKRVLGRKASPEEKRLFVATMHNAERRRDMAVSALSDPGNDATRANALSLSQGGPATTGGVTEIAGVSPGSRSDEFARNIDPLKADARKVVGAAQLLSQMLKGEV